MDTQTITLTLDINEASIVLAGVTYFERDEYLATDLRNATTELRKSIWQKICESRAQ